MTTTTEKRRSPVAALWAEAWRVALLAAVIVIAVLALPIAVVAVPFPFMLLGKYRAPVRERVTPVVVSLAAATVAIDKFVPSRIHAAQAICALLVTALYALTVSARQH
jgi:hypothetical protein